MADKPILALQPMLDALRIKQVVSFDQASALFSELFEATRVRPKAFEVSGNEWCALVNLAIARFGRADPQDPQGGNDAGN